VSYSAAYDAITRISAKAGLDGVGWHTLRHTFASLLVLEGVPLFTVSRLLGHSSIRITERYTHLNDEKNKDAVASLAIAMGA
jgi:site-specific recombinase XerD